jgi:hypothetical protein
LASVLVNAHNEYVHDCETDGHAIVGAHLAQYQAAGVLAAGFRRPVSAREGTPEDEVYDELSTQLLAIGIDVRDVDGYDVQGCVGMIVARIETKLDELRAAFPETPAQERGA